MVEVNIGAEANDGTGDPLRTAFAKINADINSVKTNINVVRSDLDAIEQLPDSLALLEAVADAQLSASSAASDRELVEAALENTSNAIFGVGDSNEGITYDVLVVDRAIVSNSDVPPFPHIDIEIETGIVVSLLKSGAAEAVGQAVTDAEVAAAEAVAIAEQLRAYSGPRVASVVALLADTGLTYAAEQVGTVLPDSFLSTIAEGFSYRVAQSTATDHHLITAGGVKLYVLAGSGKVNAKAFGAKGDGVTDDATAINKAMAVFGTVYLPEGTFAVGATLKRDNRTLIGSGASTTYIKGLSASLSADDAIIALGRTSVIENLRVGYDVLTGSEARQKRVGIDTRGMTYSLQRGSRLDNLLIQNCGTGISDFGTGSFSVTFGTLEIKDCVQAFVDFSGLIRTGNVWTNLYCAGSIYPMQYGLRFEGSEPGGSMGQVNVEHATFAVAAVSFSNMAGTVIDCLHIEGTDLAASGAALVQVNEAGPQIGSLVVRNTRQTVDNVSMIKLLTPVNAGQESAFTPVKIGCIDIQGVAWPDAGLYPSYPAGRKGLVNVAGWKFVSCADTSRRWAVEVDTYQWNVYAPSVAENLIHEMADTWYSDAANFRLWRWGARGELPAPGENLVKNSRMRAWLLTSATVTTTTPVETATGWFGYRATGTLAISRGYDGYGQNSEPFLRVSNVGTIGTYQELHHNISDFRDTLDTPLMLSFEARASVAGRRLEQITLILQNAGGTPATLYTQAVSGSSALIQFTTSWRRYRIPVAAIASSGVSVWGANPVMRLAFQINDAAASRESQLDLRNVKLERGELETALNAIVN